MAAFYYKGRDEQGKSVTGTREAISAEMLAAQLMKDKIIPVVIQPIPTAKSFTDSLNKLLRGRKVSRQNMIVFCRQMHSLCKAGIPLNTAVLRLAETTHDPLFSDALRDIAKDLSAGKNLATAMQQHPIIFPKIVINLVRISIEGASLDTIFLQIAEYLQIQETTQKQIKSVFRYPMFVLVAICMALVIINYFVIPPFAKLFASFHSQLPLPTRILLAISQDMRDYWYLVLVSVLSLFLLLRYLYSIEPVKIYNYVFLLSEVLLIKFYYHASPKHSRLFIEQVCR